MVTNDALGMSLVFTSQNAFCVGPYTTANGSLACETNSGLNSKLLVENVSVFVVSIQRKPYRVYSGGFA